MKVAVTTSRDDDILITKANSIAEELSIDFIPRKKRNLDKIRTEFDLEYLLVVERDQVVLKGKTYLAWHPGMSVPRIKALREGKTDHMVEALGLKAGCEVLDCTFGLGSDALVAAYAVGPAGHVTGLEKNKYIAWISRWGMEHFHGLNKYIHTALKRITVLNSDYLDYLGKKPSDSYDAVYFDPMFRHAREKSSSMNPLRPLACHEPLTPEAIREALRVARYRVVMKENSQGREFARLKAQYVVGGSYSPIAYGVWEKAHV